MDAIYLWVLMFGKYVRRYFTERGLNYGSALEFLSRALFFWWGFLHTEGTLAFQHAICTVSVLLQCNSCMYGYINLRKQFSLRLKFSI